MKKPPFAVASTVIRTTETDESQTGIVKGYPLDSQYIYVLWNGATKVTTHKIVHICTMDTWRRIRERQAELRNAWKARGQ